MTATNRHRKLSNSPTNGTTGIPTCLIQCDSQFNLTGLCSAECTIYCPSFCHIVEPSPQPSPSPANSPYGQPLPPEDYQSPLSIPIKISLVFLISTFIYTLYKFHLRWRRHRTPPSPSPENQESRDHDQRDVIDHPIWFIRTTGLQPSVINAITVVKYNKNDGVVEGCNCSVCLSEFEAGDMVRVLPDCKHAFHILCIDTWLRSHINCPLCRAGIVNNNVVDVTFPDRNNDDLGLRETETGESSELRIGERDEEDQIGNSDHLIAFDPNGNRVGSDDENSGIELVKLDRTTIDNNAPKREG